MRPKKTMKINKRMMKLISKVIRGNKSRINLKMLRKKRELDSEVDQLRRRLKILKLKIKSIALQSRICLLNTPDIIKILS